MNKKYQFVVDGGHTQTNDGSAMYRKGEHCTIVTKNERGGRATVLLNGNKPPFAVPLNHIQEIK